MVAWRRAVAVGALWWLGVCAGANDALSACQTCHAKAAPPLALVLRRYLLLYSAKEDVAKKMKAFLMHPSKKRSAMPEGMKNRFNPQLHPAFSAPAAKTAVWALILREDPIKKIMPPTVARSSETPEGKESRQ